MVHYVKKHGSVSINSFEIDFIAEDDTFYLSPINYGNK